jgi:hypothetical protein
MDAWQRSRSETFRSGEHKKKKKELLYYVCGECFKEYISFEANKELEWHVKNECKAYMQRLVLSAKDPVSGKNP